MAATKSAGMAAATMSAVTMVAFLVTISLDVAQGHNMQTADDNKMSVTLNTNMTVNVHAKVPGSDTAFETTVYPGSTTLSIPVPPGTDLATLSVPMQISVDPVEILGIPVTGAANSTVMVAANSIVEIQGYLTQIMNAVLGLITVYFKMIISSVPSMLPGVAVTIPNIPAVPAVPGVPSS
ncbi:hypothetical protein MPTK1_8g07510 [Marchantia polymorpha subsp. ruderalis]|uniref:Late embryogenesis abundant protein LEA-2 subgroup domain-containing protein n=2 Tax=Marchantia polymorpha TaxID=3197 RepID=A0A2R6XIA8_MARPO|nr:hypothetical protein MARPO_0013s0042 [Marchantia polymorpha]BBN19037.1 hypothetical protein Mp_8g07510 [Marchantia polymorpha subsp. ruderalis]|eukprot:PTQ45809.1 hypothetical protein MARPO_0013s0042 [Marchantia polymorpha]